MHLREYQELARKTDQVPNQDNSDDPLVPYRHDVIPLIGLVGEVGGLLEEYKKRLRDGDRHLGFSDEVAEELGDILWYTANVADKFELDLEDIAQKNLEKLTDRWKRPPNERHLYDDDLPPNQQLPREFEYRFDEQCIDGVMKINITDALLGITVGNSLTDNTYEDDGYRYHDVMHLAFAAHFGWSPVLRKLLRTQKALRNRDSPLDDAEDGGRGQVIEEALVAAAYVYASEHGFLEGVRAVDRALLRHIKKMTQNLEVKNRSAWEWNDVIIKGFSVWRDLRIQRGGTVVGNVRLGTLELRA